MSNILSELSQIKADYSAAQEQLVISANQVAEFKAALEAKELALADVSSQLEAKAVELASINESLAAKATELEEIQKLVEELKANKKTAEETAVEIVASVGIAPMKVDVSESNAVTKEDVLKRYSELLAQDSRAAGAYYAANRATISSR